MIGRCPICGAEISAVLAAQVRAGIADASCPVLERIRARALAALRLGMNAPAT